MITLSGSHCVTDNIKHFISEGVPKLKADVPEYLELAGSPVSGIYDFVLRRVNFPFKVIDFRNSEGKFQPRGV